MSNTEAWLERENLKPKNKIKKCHYFFKNKNKHYIKATGKKHTKKSNSSWIHFKKETKHSKNKLEACCFPNSNLDFYKWYTNMDERFECELCLETYNQFERYLYINVAFKSLKWFYLILLSVLKVNKQI